MQSDPHVLVALLSATLEKPVPATPSVPIRPRVVDDDDGRHDTLSVLVPSSTSGGIESTVPVGSTLPFVFTATDDYAVHSQVLDAIAGVSVFNDTEAVAVVLDIDISKKVAVLTVALNASRPDLIAHLEGLWRLMRIMSTQCEQLRGRVDQTAIGPGSPIPITEGVELWRTEFIKRVYLYCKAQQSRIFTVHRNEVTSILRSLGHIPGSDSRDLILKRKLVSGIYSWMAISSMIERIGYGGDLADYQWRDLILLMDTAVIEVQGPLDDSTLCETWLAEVGYNPHHELRHALGEIITLHRSIHNLLHFAHSAQYRTTLLCKLKVRVIPLHRAVSVSLPSTPICWQSLIESVCDDNLIANYTWLSQQVTKVQAENMGQRHANVHSVCSLIAQLETAAGMSQSPARISQSPSVYIGTSVLPCAACNAWIQAINSLGGRQYRTRGTSAEWRFPWAMPELGLATGSQKAKVSSHMAQRVAAEYVDHWTAAGQLYSPGNFPATTADGSGPSRALADAQRRQALIQGQISGVYRY